MNDINFRFENKLLKCENSTYISSLPAFRRNGHIKSNPASKSACIFIKGCILVIDNDEDVINVLKSTGVYVKNNRDNFFIQYRYSDINNNNKKKSGSFYIGKVIYAISQLKAKGIAVDETSVINWLKDNGDKFEIHHRNNRSDNRKASIEDCSTVKKNHDNHMNIYDWSIFNSLSHMKNYISFTDNCNTCTQSNHIRNRNISSWCICNNCRCPHYR